VNLVELTEAVRCAGGMLRLEGDQVRCKLPVEIAHLAPQLKEHKADLIELLRRMGGRIATFPHCPRCASYALYQRGDFGPYECLTCELTGIEEATARRVV
jgi:hypothetical protein